MSPCQAQCLAPEKSHIHRAQPSRSSRGQNGLCSTQSEARVKIAFLIKIRLPQPSADNHKAQYQPLTSLHTAGRTVCSRQRREGKITNLNKMFNLLITGQAPRGWKVLCSLHYGIPTRPWHKSCQPEADAISPSPLSLLCPCQI